MDRYSGHKSAGAQLYPTIDPFDQQILHVDGGHQVYFEQCGKADGIPVVVLHGAPVEVVAHQCVDILIQKFTELFCLISAVVEDRGHMPAWKIIPLRI